MPDRPDLAELERLLAEAVARCRNDSRLLDGRDFDEAEHDRYDDALAALLEEARKVETLRETLREIESAATTWPMESQLNRLAGIAEIAHVARRARNPRCLT